MSVEITNFSEERKSHVCSAQSDSVSSLQFDKRVKSRSYSSQFTLSDQILVGIDRREEIRPIEHSFTVEVDLCTGTISDIISTIHSKYHTIIHLDEMAQTNAWVRKMITYDLFVDKSVMQSIRDEAMEPNKLYLLKHKHKEQTTESMARNYLDNSDIPKSEKLRTTAAQFNPNKSDNKFIDRFVHSSNNNNSRNAFFKSTNVLRNELIIRTGDFIERPTNNDNEKYSTSLSVDLTTHKIPQIVSIEDLTIYDDEDYETPKQTENTKTEESVMELDLVANERTSLVVDDIPFAEESEIIDHDTVDNKRSTLSKSLQYYLPVFDTNQDVNKTYENEDSETNSNYSRSAVTTDENESMDQTDRPTILDEIDYESMNADEFDESITESKKASLSSLKEIENYSFSSERNSLIFDRSIDLDDIICQENLVIHINQDTCGDLINLNEFPKFHQLESVSKIPISQFDIINVKRNVSLSPTFQHHDLHKNKTLDFPKDFIEQRKEHFGKSRSPINEIYIFNENETESKNYNCNYEKELDLTSINEDEQIFTKTKSFSLKRKSENQEDFLISDDRNLEINPTKCDEKPSNNLYSDRKEKFLNSDLNSSIQFFKRVSEDSKIPGDTRSSTPSSEYETESVKKDEISTNSSDDSMIIKDVSSDGAYEFRGRPQNMNLKIEEEDENEITNGDSNEDLSDITNLTEEIPVKERDYSSSEDLSVYSSSSTITGSERILRELNKTPIDSTPGHFERFLKEREERILKERNSTDETSSYSEGKLEHATLIKSENLVNSEEVENTNDSSYTEETFSSSSDFLPKNRTILRQGESIEDIAKYLIYPNKENTSLIRTSGFDSQLNVIYNEENNNNNLLQNDEINKRKFSTSSEDDTSLKVSFPQNKFIERTEKLEPETIPNKKSFPKNKSDDESSSETLDSDSDSDSDSDTDTDSQQELPKTTVTSESQPEMPSKVFVAAKLNKQQSLPIMNIGEISSSSESESTNPTSTSIEEIQKNIDKDNKKKLPKYIEREEKFSKNPTIKKQMTLPARKSKRASSASESASSSQSISTSEDEIHSSNMKVTDRRENQLTKNPTKNHKKIIVSKKILSNLSKSSESSQSFSTSEDEIPPPKEIKAFEATSNEKLNLSSSQSLNKKSPILISKKNSSSSSSSTASKGSRSSSISRDESQHSYVNLTQSKFVGQDRIGSSQSIDKKIISSNTREELNSSSTESSSESVSTSSDEDQQETDERKIANKAIEHREKFANNNSKSNITKKPSDKPTDLNSESDSSYSESTSTNKSYENSKSSKMSSPRQNKDDSIKPEIITNAIVFSQEENKSDVSNISSDDESISFTIKNDSIRQENKTPPNLSIDRREKFTKLDPGQITSGFKRSASVPDYLLDSNNFSAMSSMDDIGHQNGENLAQSLKIIPTGSINNLNSDRKVHSYELLSVQLRDNVITRFIESRRKYTDNFNYSDPEGHPQQNVEYNLKKNSPLSIDRREKFCTPEEFDIITPCDNMKNEVEHSDSENSMTSLSLSSESLSSSIQLPETKILAEITNDEDKMNELHIYNVQDNHKNEVNNELLHSQKDSQNEDESYSINTSDSSTELSDEEKDIPKSTPTTNTNKQSYSIDRLEKFTDHNNLENHEHNQSKPEEIDNAPASSEYDNLLDKNKNTKNIDHDEKFDKLQNSKNQISRPKSKVDKNKNTKNIDHNKKFDKLQNLKNQISRPKSKKLLSNSSNSSTSEFESVSDDDDRKSPYKTIENQEKFVNNNSIANITKKPSDIPTGLDGESDSSYSKSSSTNNSKSSDKSGKISTDKGYPEKPGEIERCERNINQNNKCFQYGKSKAKSDSTDEDISLSLTSLPKDNQEIESDHSTYQSESKEIEIIVVDEGNHESKSNEADENISISTATSVSKNQKLNYKFEKNDKYVSRSCQTLPYKKIQIIPIKQKSKSLDKPFLHASLPVLSQNMSGSFGNIVERRYHEFTENWSRQSPIGSNNSKEIIHTKIVEDEHISSVKNTDLFIKKKFTEPLTTRPRPVPSYLSPVNAFPYVPIDPEFSSADSLVNDYSSDYNANEIMPRYKSLPEFVKSLSTTSLPKHPVESKKEIKKPIVKKKLSPQPINLDYGAVENKNIPRHAFKKKTSVTSVTTDSSYLERPILKDKETFNNYASSDSLGSLTTQSLQKDIAKTHSKVQIPNNKINLENVSSTDSSSDSDTQIEFQTPPLRPMPYLSKVSSLMNNKKKNHIPPVVNGKKDHIRKSNSLPQKRIPSSSESSEFSSTSEDDDSAEIHHL